MNDILKKFIKANNGTIKFIWQKDYLSDEEKMKRSSYFNNLNRRLFKDLINNSRG